jgi:class 3 adenylate cyclase/CheY-like chemotaxis protein
MATTDPDDLFTFAAEDPPPEESPGAGEWHVLVVDDEPHVHTVTKLALDGLRIDGARVLFDDAYSGTEAREKLSQRRYALVLLDVVMDTEHAGLEVARWLRHERQDRVTRIVLRTGQPGLAPEREVMLAYDINDYQPKTELSAQRLATSVIGAIRSYRDLSTIDAQKAGLEKIVLATASLFERRSMEQLLTGVLQQLAALLGPAESAVLFVEPPTPAQDPVVVAGTGRFEPLIGHAASEALPPPARAEVARLVSAHASGHGPGWSLYAMSRSHVAGARSAAVYLEPGGPLDPWQQRLLELFCANAAVAFDNQLLTAEQARLVQAFGRFVPQRMLDAIGVRDITQVSVGEQVQRDMSVMFVDVRSFTPLAERCGARETFRLLNRLFAEIVPVIHAHGGVVDKYLGDGLLSVFPDPGDGPVRAAVAMLHAVDRVSAAERETLDIGIGIHRGPTILGLVGAQDRLESTVISDAVNVASRLERLTRTHDARIIASAEVLPAASPLRAHARSLGRLAVRGKQLPIECFDVFASDSEEARARKLGAATDPARELDPADPDALAGRDRA